MEVGHGDRSETTLVAGRVTASASQRGARPTAGNRGCSDGVVLTGAEKCVTRRAFKVRMMSSDQGQSSADSTPRVVTNITEPRLDGNRVAPHDAGADVGRPSRSGASWYDSGSDDEEGYENQGRQRVQAETDMRGQSRVPGTARALSAQRCQRREVTTVVGMLGWFRHLWGGSADD